MNMRTEGLVALGLIEWQRALDHLTALRTAGVHVPENLSKRMEVELRLLVLRWRRWEPVGPGDVDSAVAEAREWVTTHNDTTEELLRETG